MKVWLNLEDGVQLVGRLWGGVAKMIKITKYKSQAFRCKGEAYNLGLCLKFGHSFPWIAPL